MAYFPEELREENERLINMICNPDAELSPEEIVEKHASEAYKKYIKEREEERNAYFEKGILQD